MAIIKKKSWGLLRLLRLSFVFVIFLPLVAYYSLNPQSAKRLLGSLSNPINVAHADVPNSCSSCSDDCVYGGCGCGCGCISDSDFGGNAKDDSVPSCDCGCAGCTQCLDSDPGGQTHCVDCSDP